MNKTIKFLIDGAHSGERLDIYLTKKMANFTRSSIKKLIEKKNVKVNDQIIKAPSKKIKHNDQILVKIEFEKISTLSAKEIKLEIIYEDKDILIINKPQGMVVHPGAGNFKNTLVNALLFKYKDNLSNINGDLRPGIVHRIDKNTSGLLVVAKNNFSHYEISKQFSKHSIKRSYKCLVWGVIRPLNGQIKTLITRSKKNRKLMIVSEINGKKAVTNYKTLKVFNIKDVPRISLIECNLETGRTHQIRVHLSYKGASLIGDDQYGKKNRKYKKINKEFLQNLNNLKGQCLHAQSIEFIHPTKKKIVKFQSNLPIYFKKMFNFLNNHTS